MFVLIPFGPNSKAMHFENPITPYLLAQYTANPAVGLSPAMEATFTNDAPEVKCGMHARVMLKRPFKFVVMSLSQYLSVIETVDKEVGFMPAQLKMWVNLLYLLMMEATKVLQESLKPISKAELM